MGGCFSSLMDIDKRILQTYFSFFHLCFSSLMDIDKRIPTHETSSH